MTRKGKHRKTIKRKVTRRCCSQNTHFPKRMHSCESTLHTLASYVGSPKILDFAFTRDLVVTDPQVHDNIHTTDHAPISIQVNGLRVLSWNLEGLCEKAVREQDAIQNLQSLKEMFPEPVIFLFQELFLQKDLKGVPSDKITAMATDRLNRLLGDHYTLYSDGYTGGVAIPQGIKYDGITHIDRPDSGKKCMVIKNVTHNDKTFNIVNIHLKSIVMFPITGKRLQQAEMKNIIVNTKGPTLFMGDFNTENPEQLF